MSIQKWHLSDRVRHLLYVSLASLLALLCVIAVYLCATILEDHYAVSADFSRGSIFSLSDSTVSSLARLEEDIHIYLLHESNRTDETIAQLLNILSRSSKHIRLEYVDLVRDLDIMRFFSGIKAEAGNVIVANADNSFHLVLNDSNFYLSSAGGIKGICAEQSIISAIHTVHSGGRKRVIFAHGHGEDINSISNYITVLKNRTYEILKFDVTTLEFHVLNPSSDLLVFVAPQIDLTSVESEALINYLAKGGKAIFYMENSRTIENGVGLELGKTNFHNFNRVFAAAEISLNQDIILLPENRSVFGNIVTTWSILSPIEELEHIPESIFAVKSASSSLRVPKEYSERIRIVGVSPPESYRKELKLLKHLKKDRSDPSGPFVTDAIACLGDGRIYLSGSASGIGNQNLLVFSGNYEIAMSLLSLMVGDPQNPVIQPKLFESGKIKLSTVGQQIYFAAASILLLPVLVLVIGIIVTRRRRSRKVKTVK